MTQIEDIENRVLKLGTLSGSNTVVLTHRLGFCFNTILSGGRQSHEKIGKSESRAEGFASKQSEGQFYLEEARF